MQPPPGPPPGGLPPGGSGWGPPPAPPAVPPGAPPGPMGWGSAPPAGPPGGYGVGLPPGVSVQSAFQQASTEPMGIISLVLGVLSIPLYLCCGIFALAANLVGAILGFVSLNRIKSRPELYTGRGLAIAGIIVNGLLLLLNILLTVLVFGFMGLGILTGGGSP